MSQHLYLSLMPEALIASMLGPEDFGSYYAVGDEGTDQGQAIFFEVESSFRHDFFPIEPALGRCVPHKDGRPKHTVYISAYRVLEHVPLSALGPIYLVTRDGRSLSLARGPSPAAANGGLHLYHELAPTRPEVVSTLGPVEFFELIIGTRGGFPSLPAIAFVELRLGELGADPENGGVGDLPYESLDHLRHVLAAVKDKDVKTKIFERSGPASFAFRTIKNGIFVGNAREGLGFYAFPSSAELKSTHREWWKSANL
jgi:hypothetical protein